jgi:hypothetical protein
MPEKFLRLQMHYFFDDQDKHSMNAVIRNESERELLLMFKEVISSMNLDIEIETEALEEGGLKDFYKFVTKKTKIAHVTLLLSVLAIISSRFPPSPKLHPLQIENLELMNEKLVEEREERQQKKIESLKVQLKPDTLMQIRALETSDGKEALRQLVDTIVSELDSDNKIIWHKSNYYKRLNFYQKIERISTVILDENNRQLEDERTVVKSDFSKFILRSDELPLYIDEEALIELISPVLRKGNYKWKGIYNGEAIPFYMKDDMFKKSVLNKEIEFANGSAIKCVLHQTRRIDESGMIKVIQSNVITVLEIIQNQESTATPQGIEYTKRRRLAKTQLYLNFPKND